jgi:Diadenosine tetraphosphate (Ap4A) hydrolase and other HIT family hydrolases
MAGATGEQDTGNKAFSDDIDDIISSSVIERSFALKRPFKVSFDVDCSFCRKNRQIYRADHEYEHPEPTFIRRMPVSVAALSYDQTYTGRSVVILRDHETDLNYFMKTKQMLYIAFMEDVSAVVDAIEAACKPDRINYAIYMNQNVHLHVHVIPRYKAEGDAFNEPPPFRGVDEMVPGYDYRSLALRIRKRIMHRPSPLSHYCEKLIDEGLPP